MARLPDVCILWFQSHTATLLEQACTERMQQFGDTDNDEDLWEEKELTFSSASRQKYVFVGHCSERMYLITDTV